MATAVRRTPAKSTKSPKPTREPVARRHDVVAPVAASGQARDEAPKKAAKARDARIPKGKRIRGTFSMPEADHARIARLKATAKRCGLKAKKNELLRLGLRALQGLTGPELHDALLALRVAAPARQKKAAK